MRLRFFLLPLLNVSSFIEMHGTHLVTDADAMANAVCELSFRRTKMSFHICYESMDETNEHFGVFLRIG